jgi:hypothetical protein
MAPDDGQSVRCKFCGNPFATAGAVHCPKCRAENRGERSHCIQCKDPLAQICVFCQQGSPLNVTACVRCGETFAGAAERKEKADMDRLQQQVVSGVSSVVGVLTGNQSLGSVFGGQPPQHHHQAPPQQQQQHHFAPPSTRGPKMPPY